MIIKDIKFKKYYNYTIYGYYTKISIIFYNSKLVLNLRWYPAKQFIIFIPIENINIVNKFKYIKMLSYLLNNNLYITPFINSKKLYKEDSNIQYFKPTSELLLMLLEYE